MPSTFGDQLKLFALSVDVISQARFDRVARLVDDYCNETLAIDTTRLYLASDIDGNPGLRRYKLGVLDVENVRPLKDTNGKFCNQTGMAFARAKPLWIVSRNGKQQLENCSRYTDLWSGLRSIPPFRAIGGNRAAEFVVMTSVIVPIQVGEDVLGVLNFETREYIEITDSARAELLKIAEAIGMLLHLFRVNEVQRSSTERALENLQYLLTRPLPKLTRPKIFLASSSRAEPDVIAAVIKVLKENAYADRLDLVYWKEMHKPGNINQQLLDAIASCRYAICYFSQRGEDGNYQDNPNVVFEAGMFHGRVDEITTVPSSWIPVREAQSADLPFDFAQERIVIPGRTRSGSLKTAVFANLLRRRLDSMLVHQEPAR